MTDTTLTPWATREDLAAAIREEQAQREAVADPQTQHADQLYERVTAMFQRAFPSGGFELPSRDDWRAAVAAAVPAAPDYAAINSERMAALQSRVQSQVQLLVQAMAAFAPPAAVETTALADAERNNSLLPVFAASAQ